MFSVQFPNLTKRENEHCSALEILKNMDLSCIYLAVRNTWLLQNKFYSVPWFSFLVAFTVLVQIDIFLQLNVPQFELYQSDFFIK